jgi:fructoselysine-6-P-deglycase FrlB-like protein
MDHAISVNTYCTLALAAGALANSAAEHFTSSVADSLNRAFAETAKVISNWQQQVESSEWLAPHSTSYFLARGSSLGSCYEARLLWEEGVKSPATAMGSGSFRHGPQEIVTAGARFGVWIDATEMREQDLAMARDLRKLGASVMLTGQNIPADAGDLVFQLPSIPSPWQFLVDSIPTQLIAERLARLSGVDSDTFRLCSYIVEDDGGLVGKEKGKA